MSKGDLWNKYRLSIDKNHFDRIWEEVDSINRLIRYGVSVYDVVNRVCENIVYLKVLENQYKSIGFDMEKVQSKNLELKMSGVNELKNSGRLQDYLKTLSKEERNELMSKDLGLNGIISTINLEEWKNKQSDLSRNYSVSN